MESNADADDLPLRLMHLHVVSRFDNGGITRTAN